MGFEEDRRIVKDRRQKPTKPISRYMVFGRRQAMRRQVDRKTHPYVDRYGNGLWISLLLILLLSVLDAYSTIFCLERGALELNPLMNLFIGHGYMSFFIVKYLLTGWGIFILCIYKNLSLVRIGILSMLSLYLAVITHHLFCVFRM